MDAVRKMLPIRQLYKAKTLQTTYPEGETPERVLDNLKRPKDRPCTENNEHGRFFLFIMTFFNDMTRKMYFPPCGGHRPEEGSSGGRTAYAPLFFCCAGGACGFAMSRAVYGSASIAYFNGILEYQIPSSF
jgi:hypothetical protein